MDLGNVPAALSERLGAEATSGLLQLVNHAHEEWSEDVLTRSAERFERRLTEECSKLRIEIAQGDAALRQEIAHGDAALRQEMTAGFAALRQEMSAGLAAVRQEVTAGLAAVRVELVKWSFLFWIGQVAAIAALLAFMLRGVR
jgi:hypothetical protein